MEISERFDLVSNEYGKFELVENKKSKRPDLHAFIFLDGLFEPSDRDIVSSAGHDVIYLETSSEDIEKLTDGQILELTRCGVMYDSENDCLAMFV
tara:strand:+ start:2085 stop:2369 length:285 start_codon:yes stop_codon:yes gene_type:complete